jgi:hypothetical protein
MAEPQNLLGMPANIGVGILRERVRQYERAEAEITDRDRLAMALQEIGVITDDGQMNLVKMLQEIQWDIGDGPQRMTEEEAQAVDEFAEWVIEGRKVWPTDSVGAGLKLADWHHDWAPLPEPDEWDHYDEEDAITTSVVEYVVGHSKLAP